MGDSKAALLLLSRGADPNKAAKDEYGTVSTPLNQAAYHGFTEVVKSLLEGMADPNKGQRITDKDGDVTVRSPLHEAAVFEYTEIVKSLLESKADPNTGEIIKDKDGNVTVQTPLFMAASRGYTDIVRSLLASEARQDLDTGEDEEDLADHTSLSLLPITAMSSSSPTGMSKDRH